MSKNNTNTNNTAKVKVIKTTLAKAIKAVEAGEVVLTAKDTSGQDVLGYVVAKRWYLAGSRLRTLAGSLVSEFGVAIGDLTLTETSEDTIEDARPAKAEKVAKERKPKAAKIATEEELIAKYGERIVRGTLRRDNTGSQKMVVTIRTLAADEKTFDGNTRDVYTSDVFQVKHTEEVQKAIRNSRRRKQH